MSNTIRIKRSSTAAAVPTAGQLQQGELAVNLADRKLYTKNQANAVVLLNPDPPPPPPGFNINSLTTVAPATGDFLPFADISDSNNAKKATVANVVALGLNATGAAPTFAARAWADFDGRTSPATIRASGNISSITRRATGRYTINFATAMPDANYIFSGSVEGGAGPHVMCMDTGAGGIPATSDQKNTTSCNIYVTFSGNLTNPAQGSIMFLR